MPSAENLLVSSILHNKTKRELSKANFTSENMAKFQDELFFILESKSIPSKKAFKAKFPAFIIQKIPESDIENLIKQCKENKVRVDLVSLLKITAVGFQNGDNPHKLLTNLENKARDIASQFSNTVDIDVMSNYDVIIRRYLEKRNKVKEGEIIAIPYGIKTLDKMTGGMQNKELITVAARTGIGKTWLMCKSAASSILANHPTLYLTLEMNWDDIAARIFTILSYEIARARKKTKKAMEEDILQNQEMSLGMLDERKVARIIKDIKSKIKSSLFVPDIRGKYSISSSQRKIEQLEPDVCFFDYFGLTQQSGANSKGIENWVQASEASRTAKEIARVFDIPYVLAAQINRAGANADSPRLEHISLTDSIGQDSDKVYILKTRGRKNNLQLICEKFRGGYGDWRINMEFDVNSGKITETGSQGIDEGYDEEEDDFE